MSHGFIKPIAYEEENKMFEGISLWYYWAKKIIITDSHNNIYKGYCDDVDNATNSIILETRGTYKAFAIPDISRIEMA